MMKQARRLAGWIFGYCVLGTWPTEAQVTAGRNLEERQTLTIGITVGSVFGMDGEVNEISRPIEDIGAKPETPPENYSWKELGFDDSFGSYGLFVEKLWRYATLQLQYTHGNPRLKGEADRDFYIGVEDITFEGQNYEYMKIPKGQPYHGDIDFHSLELGLRITPVSFGSSDSVEFTPWLHLGVFLFAGEYEINAGKATGVVQYENPPRDYVVGGTGSGTSGLVLPEYGFGAEWRFYLTDIAHLSVQANIAFLHFDGSSADIGISTRNEKDVEIDYVTASARIMLEIAMNEDLDLVMGIELQTWDGDGKSRAKPKTEEEVIELREKFDKDISFSMSSVSGFFGLRF